MKNLLIILSLLLFISISNLSASMYSGKDDFCIEDYYFKNGTFYYLKSRTGNWNSNTANGGGNKIEYDFNYDADNDVCSPVGVNSLGLKPTEYNFLLALCGLIFGAVFMFFTVQAFTNVGGKK
jgi:hypothetical protein